MPNEFATGIKAFKKNELIMSSLLWEV